MEENITAPENPQPPERPSLLLPMAALGLALCAILLLAAAGPGSRLGLWHFRTGFDLLKYGAWCGLLASLAALLGMATSIRERRLKGAFLALAALALGATAFAVPYSWKLTAGKLPRIHDISTDVNIPPRFVAVVPLRRDAPNPVEYGGAEIAAKQLLAYPEVKTLVLGRPPEQAFALALDTARGMGWEIVATVPAEGRIEASDTTRWFGFKDDIVVRITPAGERSLVDVRSLSRVGVSDVGTNARRIRAYLKRLEGKG